MRHVLLHRLLATALLVVSVAPSAQAANFIQVDGATMTFFYDADFWGAGGASVSGNTIAIDVPDYFDLSVDLQTGHRLLRQIDASALSVFAVAKPGYVIPGAVTGRLITEYTLAAANTLFLSTLSGNLTGGSYANGAFEGLTDAGMYFAETRLRSNGTIASGAASAWAYSYAEPPIGSYAALGISTNLNVFLDQGNFGSSRAAPSTISYQFGVSITPVPEPASYAMLAVGLALAGFAARRRKEAP